MDFHIDGEDGCNDAGESAQEDNKNDSVNNDVTRKSLYARLLKRVQKQCGD